MNFTKWGATLGEMKHERWPETRDFHSPTADNGLPSPCLTLFGSETAPSRGKNRQPPKILVTMKSDNLSIVRVIV